MSCIVSSVCFNAAHFLRELQFESCVIPKVSIFSLKVIFNCRHLLQKTTEVCIILISPFTYLNQSILYDWMNSETDAKVAPNMIPPVVIRSRSISQSQNSENCFPIITKGLL